MWTERQQADDVVHGAIGLFGKVLPQFQGVVSGKEKETENVDKASLLV